MLERPAQRGEQAVLHPVLGAHGHEKSRGREGFRVRVEGALEEARGAFEPLGPRAEARVRCRQGLARGLEEEDGAALRVGGQSASAIADAKIASASPSLPPSRDVPDAARTECGSMWSASR